MYLYIYMYILLLFYTYIYIYIHTHNSYHQLLFFPGIIPGRNDPGFVGALRTLVSSLVDTPCALLWSRCDQSIFVSKENVQKKHLGVVKCKLGEPTDVCFNMRK